MFSLEFSDEKSAKSAYSALTPDNIGVPKGIELRMRLRGRSLKVEINSNVGFGTFVSTLDDILASCHTAVSTLEAGMEKRRK